MLETVDRHRKGITDTEVLALAEVFESFLSYFNG